jgi:hypothetical protein
VRPRDHYLKRHSGKQHPMTNQKYCAKFEFQVEMVSESRWPLQQLTHREIPEVSLHICVKRRSDNDISQTLGMRIDNHLNQPKMQS